MPDVWSYEEGIAAGIYDPGTSATSPIKSDGITDFASRFGDYKSTNNAASVTTDAPTKITVTPKNGEELLTSGPVGGAIPNSWGSFNISDPAWLGGVGSMLGGSTPQAAMSNTASLGGAISAYFTRAVIIILGFIFVAAGLAMFGRDYIPKINPLK